MKSSTILRSLCALVIALFTQNLSATVHYVKGDASGQEDGTSWTDAYTTVQEALVAASSGDTIAIASGTYIPGASRTSTFRLKNQVKVFGGFAGTETINASSIAGRDFDANETILSGDLSGNDVFSDSTTMTDNVYHVVSINAYSKSYASGTMLDGVTVSGGRANTKFQTTVSTVTVWDYEYSCGAGIYIKAENTNDVSLVLSNVVVKNNRANFLGGGLFLSASDSVISPSNGEGTATLIDVDMINCTFENNAAEDDNGPSGGGIAAKTGSGSIDVFIDSCVFKGNYATTSTGINGRGGAIYNWGSSTRENAIDYDIRNSLFYDNFSNLDGAVIYNRAGAWEGFDDYKDDVTMSISNTTFAHNRNESLGIGVINEVIRNVSYSTDEASNTLNLVNVIIYDNDDMPSIVSDEASSVTNISYSLIEGSKPSGTWDSDLGNDDGNNVDADPAFYAQKMGDYRLSSASPALGTGDGINGDNIGYDQGAGLEKFVLGSIDDVTICDGEELDVIDFMVNDYDLNGLTLEAKSSDTSFVAHEDVIITGADTSRSVIVDAIGFGKSTITVYAYSSEGDTLSESFNVAIEQAPVIDSIMVMVIPGSETYAVSIEATSQTGTWHGVDSTPLVGTSQHYGLDPGTYNFWVDSENGCRVDTLVTLDTFAVDGQFTYTSDAEFDTIWGIPQIKLCGEGDSASFTVTIEDLFEESYTAIVADYYGNEVTDSYVYLEELSEGVFKVSIEKLQGTNTGIYDLQLLMTDGDDESAYYYFTIHFGQAPTIYGVNVVTEERYDDNGNMEELKCAYLELQGANFSKIWVDDTTNAQQYNGFCGLESGDHMAYAAYEFCVDSMAFSVSPASVHELEAAGIEMYPNPAANQLNLTWNSNSIEMVQVVDVHGALLIGNVDITSNGVNIDIQSLSSGMYFVKMMTDNVVLHQPFIKQ